jgi:hypothetical protein
MRRWRFRSQGFIEHADEDEKEWFWGTERSVAIHEHALWDRGACRVEVQLVMGPVGIVAGAVGEVP